MALRSTAARVLLVLGIVLVLPSAVSPVRPLAAAEPEAGAAAGEDAPKAPFTEQISTTHHSITLGGERIPYTATAGNYVIADEEGKQRASIFFVAYTREGVSDPASEAVNVGYVALLNDYLRQELGYETDLRYRSLAGEVWPWSYDDQQNQYLNVAEHLRAAITRNPALQVLFTSGYYDFATPYFDTVYTVSHLGLPAELQENVWIEYSEAGHMMYIREADHAKLARDMAELIRRATAAPTPPPPSPGG